MFREGVALVVEEVAFLQLLIYLWAPPGTQLSPVALSSCNRYSGHTPVNHLSRWVKPSEGANGPLTLGEIQDLSITAWEV